MPPIPPHKAPGSSLDSPRLSPLSSILRWREPLAGTVQLPLGEHSKSGPQPQATEGITPARATAANPRSPARRVSPACRILTLALGVCGLPQHVCAARLRPRFQRLQGRVHQR